MPQRLQLSYAALETNSDQKMFLSHIYDAGSEVWRAEWIFLKFIKLTWLPRENKKTAFPA